MANEERSPNIETIVRCVAFKERIRRAGKSWLDKKPILVDRPIDPCDTLTRTLGVKP